MTGRRMTEKEQARRLLAQWPWLLTLEEARRLVRASRERPPSRPWGVTHPVLPALHGYTLVLLVAACDGEVRVLPVPAPYVLCKTCKRPVA